MFLHAHARDAIKASKHRTKLAVSKRTIRKGNIRRRPFSIAPIALLATTLLAANTAAIADESNTERLPALGNTPALDRLMLREIPDEHIYGVTVSPQTQSLPAANADSYPLSSTEQLDSDKNLANQHNAIVIQAETYPASGPLPGTADQAFLPVLPENQSADLIQAASSDEPVSVWQRIRGSKRLPLASNERVAFYEQQYEREALWIGKILQRGAPFLSHVLGALDRRYLPLELALLPAIESGYLPEARSSGHATGLWQIVPITAREIGVERNEWFDGRGDIIASTTAAIDYLTYLNAEFNGDWELTLAAYNAGPGRVRSAVRKNKSAGRDTDYWSLDLPQETKNYVPKLIALVNIVRNPVGGLDLPKITEEHAFESIDPGFRVSIDRVASITGIDAKILRKLNAGLIHGVTPPNGPHHLLIPAGSGESFMEAFSNIDVASAFSEPKTHEVVAGDTISDIALNYGISQNQLLIMNGLDDAKIRIGQKLAVYDVTNHGDSVIEYTVSIGDTLSEIAQRFSVSITDIRTNKGKPLNNDIIHPGDTLSIPIQISTSG